ncbi:MAG: ABC transporter substrate-binding protein, partial [Alphaproteobacteria bacterium]|nr:ABC transporter substrate-binding protein [Alphaproteobacteria bacterium]
MRISRRDAIKLGAAGFSGAALGVGAGAQAHAQNSAQNSAQNPAQTPASTGWPQPLRPGERESYGLSTFGELALPEDFKHYGYVNPQAPKGGRLALNVTSTGAVNGTFETFDSFNTFILRGDGAAGMDYIYDTLMTGTGDEPASMYGLAAQRVRWSEDRLTYRFLLRPQARFHDGVRMTAHDAAFSFNLLKEKGHPLYKVILREFLKAEAESDDVVRVTFAPNRGRDIHLTIAGMPILPRHYWKDRDFESPTLERPLGSGAYRIGHFEQGRFLEYDRVDSYWGRDLPVNAGINNFATVRYEYFRDRQIAFEAFKSGMLNYREEFTARIWATSYRFPAMAQGKVKREELAEGRAAPIQGWYFNTRRKQFKDARVREALALAFDFEWTNRNIMYSAYARTASFFQNTDMQARGLPGPDELQLLEKWRGKIPDEVFGEPWSPPASDRTGSDRKLLRQASALLAQAGCKRDDARLTLPDGTPFEIEFLQNDTVFNPHTMPFQNNLRKLGIMTRIRLVDAAQYKRRTDSFDFDMLVAARGGLLTPGEGLRSHYSGQSASMNGTRNFAGINDPAIDELLEVIAKAQTRAALDSATRALDRLLRAGRYWIPM